MIGLITLAIAVAVNFVGKNLSRNFASVAQAFDPQPGAGTGAGTGGGKAGTGGKTSKIL